MKKLLLTGLFAAMSGVLMSVGLGACARSTTTSHPVPESSGSRAGAGALSPQGAVERFLDAVRAQDLQSMSLIWGTARGPARDNMPREELEKREIVLQCYLKHDSFNILDESNDSGGRRVFKVQLKNARLTRTTTLHAIKGPKGRWYVEKVDIAVLRDFCKGL